jgi:hypothetical protein
MTDLELEHVDAVLAMLIISAREAQPFTPRERVALEAILMVSADVDTAAARRLMADLINARTRS